MARPKKNCKLKPDQPLPVIKNEAGVIYKFRGLFNGVSVVIEDDADMRKIISMGFFGKATLSRNFPNFQAHKPEIIRRRVFESRKRHSEPKNSPRKVVILPDSDSEDDYFTNLKPEYNLDKSGVKEVVNLGLEEAFFLASAVECLSVFYENKTLDCEALWDLFKSSDKYFVQNYLVYYYFRSKNWVVKPGIKFGGDFLLYKQGPPFFHASYVVIIHNLDDNLQKIENFNRRSMGYAPLMGLHRLCETAGKELLICDIIWPSTLLQTDVSHKDLPNFTIKETVMKRWISSQERQTDLDDF